MKHPRKNVEKNQTRISTSKTRTLRLVESRHFPTFFSFVSIDPESAILLIVPSSCNSIGFREHIKTIENKTLLFPLQCSEQVFFSPYFKIVSPDKRKKNNSNRSQFTTNSRKIKFLIETKTNTNTRTHKKRETHTESNINKRKYFARAKTKWFYFFRFKFYYLRE